MFDIESGNIESGGDEHEGYGRKGARALGASILTSVQQSRSTVGITWALKRYLRQRSYISAQE